MNSLNPLNEQEVDAWQDRLVDALIDLRESRVPFIEGVRNVLAIANEPRERDRDFDLFVAIDSETDHLPPSRARPQCSKEWLAHCDHEASEAELFYRDSVRKSIEHILGKLNRA